MASQRAYIYYLSTSQEWYDNSFDTDYESAVVIAPNSKVALNTHPSGNGPRQKKTGFLHADWPPHDEDSVDIVRIGTAEKAYLRDTDYLKNVKRGYGYVVCSVPDSV